MLLTYKTVFPEYWLSIRFKFDIYRHTLLKNSLLINFKLSHKLYFLFCLMVRK